MVRLEGRDVKTNRWIWHVNFFHVRDFPEMLITGREKLFWSTWMKNETYDPSAIDETAVDEWVRCSSAPGGLRAIFEVYRATFKNIEDCTRWGKKKLAMPVLTIGSQYFVGEENSQANGASVRPRIAVCRDRLRTFDGPRTPRKTREGNARVLRFVSMPAAREPRASMPHWSRLRRCFGAPP